MRLSLRRRLLTVSALAAVACAGALYAVFPLARSSQDQRLERARDLAERNVERVRDRSERPRREDGKAPMRPFDRPGSRRGALRKVWNGRLDADLRVPPSSGAPADVRAEIERMARELPAGDAIAQRDVDADDGVVAVAMGRAGDGAVAFSAVMLTEPEEAVRWRIGVLVLAAATVLLVIASLHALVAIGRGTRTLSASLRELASDLSAPVARPRVQELAQVGDGIADMAARLRKAHDEETRLTTELARQERLASLGRIAAGVAHEVRNPLAAIKLRVDLLRLGAVTPEVARDLGDVASEVTRLDRLVADLLVATGKRVEQRRTVDLGELAVGRAELLAPWAAERDVGIVASGAGHADVDADSIVRVLDNLIRNAVEASPKGSEVRVEVATHDEHVVVSVVDRGDGIAQAHVAQIFEPFFTTKPDGTGLGLAICRSIATSHDGELGYRRVGDTTRFELRLPSKALG